MDFKKNILTQIPTITLDQKNYRLDNAEPTHTLSLRLQVPTHSCVSTVRFLPSAEMLRVVNQKVQWVDS